MGNIRIANHRLEKMFQVPDSSETPEIVDDHSDETCMHLFQVLTGRMIQYNSEYTYLYWDDLAYAHPYIKVDKILEYRRKALEAYMKKEHLFISHSDLVEIYELTREIPQSKLNFEERKQFIMDMRPKLVNIIKEIDKDYCAVSEVFEIIE